MWCSEARCLEARGAMLKFVVTSDDDVIKAWSLAIKE
jgi:hypothetical protein